MEWIAFVLSAYKLEFKSYGYFSADLQKEMKLSFTQFDIHLQMAAL